MRLRAEFQLSMIRRSVWSALLLVCFNVFAAATPTDGTNEYYEASVRSNYATQDTYAVVAPIAPGLKANSELKPGIYIYAGKSGNPTLILPGIVTGVSR